MRGWSRTDQLPRLRQLLVLGTQGSFVRERHAVRLEDVWDLLPPNLDYLLTGRERLTPLSVGDVIIGDYAHPLLSASVCDIPDRVIEASTCAALADFLTSYPAVAKHESYVITHPLNLGSKALPDYTRYNHGGGELVVNWEMPQGPATEAERLKYLRSMTYGYSRGRHFLPVLSPMDRELHPLMAWWAVLYTLSMLARYQPAAWVKLISVDDSHHAVPIERLLERAISRLPVLIADTIAEVSA
ncbi:YaaC family protein [Streptomyces decoyicus]|uniref:YaaC family protein n=1 Tax=Streptomyces decoyicus TaxID=249567 RepID=UPI003868F46E